MKRVRAGLLGAILVFGAVKSMRAQDVRPPVEVGVGVSTLQTVPYEDFFANDFADPALDVRLTVPFTPRFSFETTATLGRRSNQYFSRTEGLYLLRVKQQLRSATGGRFHAFLSYGVAGYYARVSQREVRIVQPDGQTLISPAFRYTEWDEPLATFVGGGVQHAITPRAALRAEGQLLSLVYIPLGVRWSASVSIPFGRYDRD
jgi:hypothetical protein